jgi:5-methylcytosine-specific restriction endonuclease McrA
MARKEFSKKVQRDAFARAKGRCEKCSAWLSVGKFHYDHVNPDAMTGEPTLENCEVLCLPCHGDKTKRDVANIARAKRIQDRHLGIRDPHKRPLPGSRNSNIKKKMDGTVVYRDTGLPVR